MIQGIFHVNINVSDFDRSLAFYKMLGFRVLRDLGTGGSKQLDIGLNLRNGRARAALLVLGDDPHATRIDLIEWTRPPPTGKPYADLNHIGIARIAFKTKHLLMEYERLKKEGVHFLSSPQETILGDSRTLFVCFHDPDGTVLELIDF